MWNTILSNSCPLNNNIPDWLRYIAEGRLEEAYQVSASTNAFPEVCGRVCPQDRLCEGNCVVEQAGFGAITIGNLEKYLTEIAWEKGWVKNLSSQNQYKQSCNNRIGSCRNGRFSLFNSKWISSRCL